MSPRLLSPGDAGEAIAHHLNRTWADRVCAELKGTAQEPYECRLRPGVSGSAAVERTGFGPWTDWLLTWRRVPLVDVAGVDLTSSEIRVAGGTSRAPVSIEVRDLQAGIDALRTLGGPSLEVDVERARAIGAKFWNTGAHLSASALRKACRLDDHDVEVLAEVVTWLADHDELGQWSTRQLPIPGMHTKWLSAHDSLVEMLVGRTVTAETRARPAVVHLTYVDPVYLASGQRRHDAWTAGDSHEPAYLPTRVLIVENRDCRIWFPHSPGTIVVEGGGRAASASLRDVPWLRSAELVAYWGDMDADGFAILDHLRGELAPLGVELHSILMDESARIRYVHLGVNRDKRGATLGPSSTRLPRLTPTEAECYAALATAGATSTRRIEQERIPHADALAALDALPSD